MGMASTLNTVSKSSSKAQLEALTILEKAWAEGLPELRVPSDGFFLALLRMEGLATAEWGIDRTRRKAFTCRKAGNAMDADRARNFCLSVAFNADAGDFPDRKAGRRTA
jgi:hypothetical protein